MTQARLEAYFRETINSLPLGSDGIPGWSIAQLATLPRDGERRWMEMLCEHADGATLAVKVPIHGYDMGPAVVDCAVMGLAILRGVDLADLRRRLDEPMTFTAREICRLCGLERTESDVDRLPSPRWSVRAHVGTCCDGPACAAEALRRLSADDGR